MPETYAPACLPRRLVRRLCDYLFQPPADIVIRALFYAEGVKTK